MKIKFLIFIILILNFIIPFVNSQYQYEPGIFPFSPFYNFFDFSFTSFWDFYESNSSWLDFFIVFGFFMVALKSTFEENLGKAAPIFISLILAIGFASLERKYSFNLGYFWPIAALLILLILFHAIFKKAEEHRRGSIAAFIVLGIVGLIALYYFFGDKATTFVTNRPFLSSGIGILAIGLTAFILYSVFRSREAVPGLPSGEIPARPAAAQQITKPSLLQRLHLAKTEEDKEFNGLRVLVLDFLNLSKDPETKEEFFERRYNATGVKLNEFLQKYPNSKYRSRIFQLEQQLQKAYEEFYDVRKRAVETAQNVKQEITDAISKIEFALAGLKKDPNTYSLDELKEIYSEGYQFYTQKGHSIPNFNEKLRLSLVKLAGIIQKTPSETIETIERKADLQINALNEILAPTAEYSFTQMENAYNKHEQFYNSYTIKSTKKNDILNLLNLLKQEIQDRVNQITRNISQINTNFEITPKETVEKVCDDAIEILKSPYLNKKQKKELRKLTKELALELNIKHSISKKVPRIWAF